MSSQPQCIGIILDGNRRWATERGLPKLEGHRRGADALIEITKTVRDAHIAHLAVFAFSTENWGREEQEVSYLMDLLREFFKKRLDDLHQENVRVRFAGQVDRFSPELQEILRNAEQETSKNTGITLWVCLSYGGRAEIVAAAKAACAAEEEITEESLNKHMWTGEMPDPDIIIRTSGEQRLSGFLTWRGVYSELFFIDTKWPDFSKEILDQILAEYSSRQRRMGK